MSEEFVLVGSFKYSKERGEYIGIVCKQEKGTLEVLTIGAESTEFAILEWIRETVKIIRATGSLTAQAPDMYDRAGAFEQGRTN